MSMRLMSSGLALLLGLCSSSLPAQAEVRVAAGYGLAHAPPSGSLCSPADSDFDGYRYPEQIPHCKRDVSTSQKRGVKARYGISPESYDLYEVDHFIPLGLGGDNSSDNLWPLPHSLAREKAQLEQRLNELLQAGSITQREAIRTIRAWHPGGY